MLWLRGEEKNEQERRGEGRIGKERDEDKCFPTILEFYSILLYFSYYYTILLFTISTETIPFVLYHEFVKTGYGQ